MKQLNVGSRFQVGSRFLVVTIMFFCFTSIYASIDPQNGLYFERISETEAMVSGYDRSGTEWMDVTIPTEVVGKVWHGWESEEVTYRVTEIKQSAFLGCKRLRSIIIPNTIRKIGGAAFEECSNLSKVVLPEGSLKALDYQTFAHCTSLRSIKIPQSIEVLSHSVFYDCANLEQVSLPASIKSMGKYSFSECKKLKSIELPKMLNKVEDTFFLRCESLTDVVIHNSVTSIGESAFQSCVNLQAITIPESVTSIGEDAFAWCKKLESISILGPITEIKSGTFYGCESLLSIEIPNSVVTIRNEAFRQCYSVTSIKIPSSVKTIEKGAFELCKDFNNDFFKVYCAGYDPASCDDQTWGWNNGKDEVHYNALLFVPKASLERYKNDFVWKRFRISSMMNLNPRHCFDMSYSGWEDIDICGVTADGLTELDVTQEERSKENAPDFNSVRFKFEINGEECSDEKLTGKCGQLEWKNEKEWGFTYTVPEDFPESIDENEYTLSITLEKEENGLIGILGGAEIKIYRPGVLLVHGLNSSDKCFNDLKSYLTSQGGYESSQIVNVNYRSSNLSAFDINTNQVKVIGNNAEKLFEQLAKNGIVSTSYDMVGHSMGGILARKYAQEVDQESVNRIITVNTPHLGSEGGNELVDLLRISSNNSILAGILSILSSKGAIGDLRVNSKAIEKLNSGVALKPSHAICSYLNNDENTKENDLITKLTAFMFPSVLEYFLQVKDVDLPLTDIKVLNSIFGEKKHDGIVTFESQLGGLSEQAGTATVYPSEYKGSFGSSSLTHHCNITEYRPAEAKIVELLHKPKSSNAFAQNGFSSRNYNIRKRTSKVENRIQFRTPSDEQFIKLGYEYDESERLLKVTTNGSSDLMTNLVFIPVDKDSIFCGLDKDGYTFKIPATFGGELHVYALGRTNDDALVGDSLVLMMERSASLNYLFFEDWPSMTLINGQQVELNVVGGWDNGDEGYVSPIYTTDKDGVLKIDGTQITAIGEGDCLLIANYEGLADTLQVTVMSSQPTLIVNLKTDKPQISYNGDELKVVLGQSYNGDIIVEICDLSGRVVYRGHRQVSVQAGDPIYFNLSSLPSQLYIARIRTSDESSMKFYKR